MNFVGGAREGVCDADAKGVWRHELASHDALFFTAGLFYELLITKVSE